MTKTCIKCQVEKPVDSFYESFAKCRPCVKEYNKERKAAINADPVKRAKFLADKRAYGLIHRSSWAQPDPQTQKMYHRRHLDKYPEKRAAHRAVQKAIKSGKLQRQPCEVCQSASTQAHHDDYSKKLSVRWLCRTHHEQFHHSSE